MGKVRAGFGQRTVLRLEPSRAASTVGHALMALFMLAIAAGALTMRTSDWTDSWRERGFDPPDTVLELVAGGAALFAVLAAVVTVVDGLRWRTARQVLRMSEDPALTGLVPTHESSVASTHPDTIPPLEVRFVRPSKLAKPAARLRPVTSDANIIGRRPLHIAYLRLFDNQPRVRTFIESSWREFGHVYLLRCATSVTRREYTSARRTGGFASLFVTTDDQFVASLAAQPAGPNPKGSYTLRSIGPTRIRVRDRYGSYPVRAVLCHGTYWRRAVDILLERVDLAVTDLSGFTERNAGTAYEMQRVIDRLPIERVVFLCDQRSKRQFLEHEIRRAWASMAADSPNAAGDRARSTVVAVTDVFRSTSNDQGETQQVRLVARRRPTRRLVAAAQDRLDHFDAPVTTVR